MNEAWMQGVAQMLAVDAPALPPPEWMLGGMRLGWCVVLAWLATALAAGLGRRWRCAGSMAGTMGLALGVVVGMWAWVPGTWGASYWLGLAFQSPSLSAQLLCGAWLFARARAVLKRGGDHGKSADSPEQEWGVLVLAGLGVALGWVLLLDTFALLPGQWYRLGFMPLTSVLVFVLAALPWVLRGRLACVQGAPLWAVPLAVLAFVVLRLPSGNLWDAVLDPWLWLVLHAVLARRLLCWRRQASGLR